MPLTGGSNITNSIALLEDDYRETFYLIMPWSTAMVHLAF
jgi:hypothetical protein